MTADYEFEGISGLYGRLGRGGHYGQDNQGELYVLSLNGGVYQISRLTLAAGARLEPSEPVVVLVAGNLTTTYAQGNNQTTSGGSNVNSNNPTFQGVGTVTSGNVTLDPAGPGLAAQVIGTWVYVAPT